MVGVSCTFSIDRGGHCSVLYIKGGIEIGPIHKGGKVQFAQRYKIRVFFVRKYHSI